jgi:hypothetical protein
LQARDSKKINLEMFNSIVLLAECRWLGFHFKLKASKRSEVFLLGTQHMQLVHCMENDRQLKCSKE